MAHEQIQYTDTCKLQVQSADNRLTVLLDPDDGTRSATVYQFHGNGISAQSSAEVDFVPVRQPSAAPPTSR